jgi:hypothetical protein
MLPTMLEGNRALNVGLSGHSFSLGWMASVQKGGEIMARKAGQIISRGDRTWFVRVYTDRVPETQKCTYLNRTIHGIRRDAQEFLNHALVERDPTRSAVARAAVAGRRPGSSWPCDPELIGARRAAFFYSGMIFTRGSLLSSPAHSNAG